MAAEARKETKMASKRMLNPGCGSCGKYLWDLSWGTVLKLVMLMKENLESKRREMLLCFILFDDSLRGAQVVLHSWFLMASYSYLDTSPLVLVMVHSEHHTYLGTEVAAPRVPAARCISFMAESWASLDTSKVCQCGLTPCQLHRLDVAM